MNEYVNKGTSNIQRRTFNIEPEGKRVTKAFDVRRSMLNVRRSAVVLCLAFILALPALAQEDRTLRESESFKTIERDDGKVLKLNLTSTVMRKRTAAPMVLEAAFDYAGRSLLEGRLELTFKDRSGAVVGVYLGQELALTTGRQAHRLMAPMMGGNAASGTLYVTARFLAAKRRALALGDFPVPVPDPSERSLVMCIGEAASGTGAGSDVFKLAQALRLERFDPAKTSPDGRARRVFTANAYLPVEDFPTHPLAFCQYDVVFLTPMAFSLLKERQLEALKRWVEAGGALLVCPRVAAREHHLRFLNDLAGRPAFEMDAKGVIQTGEGFPATGLGMYRPELGRAVVAMKLPDVEKEIDNPNNPDNPAAVAWRTAAAFLWRVRAAQWTNVVRKDVWTTDQQWGVDSSRNPYSDLSGVSYAALGLLSQRSLIGALMPATVRLIPFHVVVAMLIVFLVAIGPLDFVVLGLLHRRKYTWIFLPVMCVAFTATAKALADHYMGRDDSRQAVTFCDVARDGRVLRATRCELVYAGRQKDIHTRLENALYANLSAGPMADYAGAMSGAELSHYDGRVPASYTVTQQVKQWTPQLNRSFSFDAHPPGTKIQWDAVTPALFGTAEGRRQAADRLLGGRGVRASVVILHRWDAVSARAGANPFLAETSDTHGMWNVIKETAAPRQRGFFSVVSQISPVGGNHFEDLALLDPTDAKQWVVAVTVKERGEWVVYRRLYVE